MKRCSWLRTHQKDIDCVTVNAMKNHNLKFHLERPTFYYWYRVVFVIVIVDTKLSQLEVSRLLAKQQENLFTFIH